MTTAAKTIASPREVAHEWCCSRGWRSDHEDHPSRYRNPGRIDCFGSAETMADARDHSEICSSMAKLIESDRDSILDTLVKQ